MGLIGQSPGGVSGRPRPPQRRSYSRERRVSLCEILDRVLNRGAVIAGDVVISVADVDLLYVGLNLVVGSVETMRGGAVERSRTRDEP
jgi:hypothetical protein